MAEKSFLWADGTGGDESPISEADTADLFKALLGGYGVLRGYQNELACTVSGLNVLTDTGWAISRTGYPYRNTASKSTAITTPSIGTTGHRIVLRENTTSNTVRITDVASADGTSAIPAAASTDVTLATLTITTLGVITLTDAREYAGLDVFDEIDNLFRNKRRLIAQAAWPVFPGTYSSLTGFGVNPAFSATGISLTDNAASGTVDPYVSAATTGATSVFIGSNSHGGSNTLAAVRPDESPRMLIRWFPGASNANLTTTLAGFVAAAASISATMNGAYLRANTTGNLFFVTRQGGSETTTDLGARPTTPTSYVIWTPDDGVTWYCYNATTRTLVATHTTDVPTATTVLAHAMAGLSAAGAINAFNVTYYSVDTKAGAA